MASITAFGGEVKESFERRQHLARELRVKGEGENSRQKGTMYEKKAWNFMVNYKELTVISRKDRGENIAQQAWECEQIVKNSIH